MLYYLVSSIINVFLIILIVDFVLMGFFSFRFSVKSKKSEFVITRENKIDFQTNVECAGFSCAYILRHFGTEANGNDIYQKIQNKMKDGCVYPKQVKKFLNQNGIKANYVVGNLNALKNQIAKGNPVIAFIRVHKNKPNLHFVPIVGYDKENLFLAESIEYLANCKTEHYNRKLPNKEFLKLWNTSMLKMPVHTHSFFIVRSMSN